MNYVIIFAGGVGARMGSDRPKQFLKVDGKPILAHTIEKFEKHPDINGIIVVSNKDYIGNCKELMSIYRLTKVFDVIAGGETGQLSIYNGLKHLVKNVSKNSNEDIVLVHDGVRPLINKDLITDSIRCCKVNGNSIAVSKAIETVIRVDQNGKLKETVDRSECRYAKAPQCFKIADLWSAHMWAMTIKDFSFIDSATLMSRYGYELHTTECSAENIKITTPNDFYTFEALYHAKKDIK